MSEEPAPVTDLSPERAADLAAAPLARAYLAGDADPVAVTEIFLERIAEAEGAAVYLATTADRARREAEAARQRYEAGRPASPLDGVPVAWKDLFDVAGTVTTAGSALLRNAAPAERDAPVVAQLAAAGMVCLGKVNLTEFAYSGLGLNPHFGTCANPHDPETPRVPGGSSSGAAASVAFGLAAAAVGSDTGGSVRVPAAWNDLVGLKCTHGRLPIEGVLPLCPSFDSIGPLTRTVEDAALMLAMLEGGKPPALGGARLDGARLLALANLDRGGEAPEVAAGFEAAREALQKAGARIDEAEVPAAMAAMELWPALFAPEAYGVWRDVIEAAPERMFPQILARFRGGRDVPAADFVAAWRRLADLRQAWTAACAGYDAVILPTAPNLPPNAARLLEDEDHYVTENLRTLSYTRIGNLMGAAGLTIPTGAPSVGLMLLGPAGSEARLLRLGAAAEAAVTAAAPG